MATVTQTTTTSVKPAAPKPGFLSSEFFAIASSTLLPLALTAMGHAPDPIVAAVGMALSAAYALLRTWLKTKHIDAAAMLEAVHKMEAAAEAGIGKPLPADVKLAVESAVPVVAAAVNPPAAS